MKTLLVTLGLLFSLLASAAEDAKILNGNTMISDGDLHELLIVLPDVEATAQLKVKSRGLKVVDSEMLAHGLARVRVLPKNVKQLTQRKLEIRTSGKKDSKAQLSIDVLPGPAGLLRVTTDPPFLPGSVSEAQVRITIQGSHPQAPEARNVVVEASSGTISDMVRMPDGSFVGRYTPPKRRTADMVVLAAADAHYPDRILGAAVLPVLETRTIRVKSKGPHPHFVDYGDRVHGPFQPQKGDFEVRLEVDARHPTAGLRVKPDQKDDIKESIALLEEKPSRMHFFPLPKSFPQGEELDIHVLVLGPNGLPLDDAAPLLGAHPMEPLGSGVYRATKTAPDGESKWVLKAFSDALEEQVTIPLTAPFPKSPPLSRVKAVQRPVGHVLVWPKSPLQLGQETELLAVATDHWGLPVARVDITLSVPSGDALLPPKATTDRRGMASLKMRVGNNPNPIVVRITANGVTTEQALAVQAPTARFYPAGDAELQARYDAWWIVVPDGTHPRRSQFTPPAAVEDGPALQAVAEKKTREKKEAVPLPEAKNGIQWRLQLLDLGRTHVTEGEKGSLFPSIVRYDKTLPLGIIGFDAAFQWEFKAGLEADIRGRISLLNQNTAAAIQGGYPSSLQIGVLKTMKLGNGKAYGGLWAHRFDAWVSRHVTAAGGPVALLPIGVYGGRLGLGATQRVQSTELRLELATTFAPWPVDVGVSTGIGLPADWLGLPPSMQLAIDYDYNYRQMRFALEEDEAHVLGSLSALRIGIRGQL